MKSDFPTLHRWSRLSSSCLVLIALLLPVMANAQYRPPVWTLKDHATIRVFADGTSIETREVSRRIETDGGVERHGEARLPYIESMAAVQVIEAWTQTADGRRIDVQPDQIRTVSDGQSEEQSFGDGKVKVIIFPEVAKGSVLNYRVQVSEHTKPFPGHFHYARYVSPHFKSDDVLVRIEYSQAIALKFSSRGFNDVEKPSSEGLDLGWQVREFRFRQNEANPPEKNRVDLVDFAPGVLVTSFPGYAALAQAYRSRADPRAEVTDSVAAQARSLVAGMTKEQDKLRALYHWVSRNIRYVDANVGVGGWIPRPAAQVLQTRWGDCKDHVTLLQSLLKAVGIESTPALINSGDAYRLPEIAVASPFNHVITYVPSIGLFMDSTAGYAPLGVLPDSVAGKPALITTTGEILLTPPTHPAKDRTVTRTVMQVLSDGRIEGRSEVRMYGSHEYESRATQASYRDRDQRPIIDRLLARFQESGSGKIETQDPADLETRWTVTARFELDPLANVPGPSALSVPVGLAPGNIRDLLTEKPVDSRRFPATCESTSYAEETVISLPQSVKVQRIPPNVDYAKDGLMYSVRYTQRGHTVTATRHFSALRERRSCDARDDDAWRAFLPVLQRDLRGQIFFR